MDTGTPRRGAEPDPVAALMGQIRDLQNRVDSLERATTLRNASISGGDGLRILDADGNTLVTLSTQNGGGVIASDGAGNDVARFGPLVNSAPGQYGVEVLVGGTWVQLGAQVATFGNLSGIPSTYDPVTTLWQPKNHHHPGTDIDTAVANATAAVTATTATNANHATDATGSNSGYNNTVQGTSFVAIWAGNDSNFSFGRNTSSIRGKQNVREHWVDPAKVLSVISVLYDRIPQPPFLASTNELGLIAEQVNQVLPEIVTWFDGEIDGIRYDLLAVALLAVVKDHEARLATIEGYISQIPPNILKKFTPPPPPLKATPTPPGVAPADPPPPLPYTIQPQTDTGGTTP